MLADLRYALRLLIKSPGFTLAAVLSLALGIGANTAIFSLIDSVMLKTLPVPSPNELVILGESEGRTIGVSSNPTASPFSYPRYRELRDGTSSLSNLAAITSTDYNAYLASSGGPRQTASVRLVSGNYFATLQISAAAGRVFEPSDDRDPGAHPVAVISHAFWQNQLGGAANIIGSELQFNDRAYTVLGVTPESFQGERRGDVAEIWVPLAMQAEIMRDVSWHEQRRRSFLITIGRLAPGVSLEQAQARLATLWQQNILAEAGPDITQERRDQLAEIPLIVRPGAQGFDSLSQFRDPLTVLMGVVGLVLLIACANVANLLLGRATARQREIGVRLALGAGRARLIRQLLTESLLLASLGAALGLLFANWSRTLLVSMISANPTSLGLAPSTDLRVLGFTIAAAVLTGILFGLLPAARASRTNLVSSLKSNSRGIIEGGRFSSQRALVIGQAALSLVLLVGAGLFLQSLNSLLQSEMGFRVESLSALRIDPRGAGMTPEQTPALYRRVIETAEAVPGVESATVGVDALVTNSRYSNTIDIEGYEVAEDENPEAGIIWVTPGYFQVTGIPVLKGRAFDESDLPSSPPVVLVNRTLADRYFSSRDPLGGRIQIGGDWVEIAGVVNNAKHYGIRDPDRPVIYRSVNQDPKFLRGLLVRTRGEPEPILAGVRQTIEQAEPGLPVRAGQTIEQRIHGAVRLDRILANLTIAFALLALTLAALGLYGVMSYAVSRRVNELGIRMALGAERRDLLWLVLREALALAALGATVGAAAALAAGNLIARLLHEVSPQSPSALALACAILLAVATLAALAPALRAARLDPLVALRDE